MLDLLELTIFGVALWMGLYLLLRSLPVGRWTGAGLVCYSVALALLHVDRTVTVLMGLPLAIWLYALWQMRAQLAPAYKRGLRAAAGLILLFTVSLGLGIGLLLLPGLLPPAITALLIGGDLLGLGYAVGVLDAFEQGETLLADFVRSFVEFLLLALLFCAQVVIIGWASEAPPTAVDLLLLMLIASAALLAVFGNSLGALLDSIVFARLPVLRAERITLRETAAQLPRAATVAEWNTETFDRHVRAAISRLGNLPKLASSPLLHLPLIDRRLQSRGVEESTLARAAELKELLEESICRLRPAEDERFSNGEAWRHFNALYYPYVRGLRPSSRPNGAAQLDESDKEALRWLRNEVPRRTLYNWQSAAAKLVALDLREQLAQFGTHFH